MKHPIFNFKAKHIPAGILFMMFCTFLLSSTVYGQPESENPPNIIIILVDDMGYADVGFNGCKDIPTPHIDRLAASGVKFTNGYVSYAVCGPSRAGLMTGRFQERFGFGRNPLFASNDPGMGLPLSEETLADALGKADYKSVVLGKWHLGAHKTLHPLERGFHDFFGFLSGGHQYFPEKWTLADEFEARSQYDGYKTKLLRNHERVEETEYLTDALSREAVSYIEKYQNDPFFIYLAYNAPHGPLQATRKYLDRFSHMEESKRKTYAAMVSAVDDGVGEVLDKLEELGLRENTMIWFLSDNGGPENRNASDNGVLRGQKSDVYEGGIRVPFALSWPAEIEAASVYKKPVISLDIFATAIAHAGKKIPTKNPIDGVDLLPFIQYKKRGLPHQLLYWRKYDEGNFALRNGDEKLVFYEKEGKMLFNLKKDVSEENNLQQAQPKRYNKLLEYYQKMDDEMQPPTFLGLRQNKQYNQQHPDRWKRPE